eukprot:CAMPEP_0116544936 /NCGR_PEP_ID=MMETSP0397-20121206/2387_1 /TAXON_ID=216820 /ORGANISM="Cyclophora tenuis, Strain ECT3854" /LENGTH=379 /DNA_ID=CAMNT_0004069189 /DNA_START=273 /DNA_END=1413 /DNA_ORIENTATION=-
MPYNARIGPPKPVIPTKEHEHVVSKFLFMDEFTGERYEEYIEPLVSHLRFPLTHCMRNYPDEEEFKYHMVSFRGWLIPPPPGVRRDRSIYFDAGASSWDKGSGGPSLKYFYKMWLRHGIDFDEIYAFEMATTEEVFKNSLPGNVKKRTHFQQCAVSSSPTDDSPEHPFPPAVIKRTTNPDDYVLFKLDIDSPDVEDGSILSILEDPNSHIDELVWEHHVRGNYLMTEWGEAQNLADVSLRESYELFFLCDKKESEHILGSRDTDTRIHTRLSHVFYKSIVEFTSYITVFKPHPIQKCHSGCTCLGIHMQHPQVDTGNRSAPCCLRAMNNHALCRVFPPRKRQLCLDISDLMGEALVAVSMILSWAGELALTKEEEWVGL